MKFPQIKIKYAQVSRAKQLKNDLLQLKNSILDFAPKNYTVHRLNGLRIRIFPFSREENCNEYFFIKNRKKYVCLNSRLLLKSYYTSLQYLLHGIAHSFCHLREDISEEVFCEYVSYAILQEFLRKKGEKFRRRIVKSIMNASPREYNTYFRVGRKLEKKEKKILLKLNSRAKNRKLSKKEEKLVFSRLLKLKKIDDNDESCNDACELEKGFKKV
ncbi:MAG: hypothetical protein QMD36_03635 [Candidatus Aenigmarchaeota archaeon]|nr:hypothetical protein [Candidatus Aenigmarchaeota archaeon]